MIDNFYDWSLKIDENLKSSLKEKILEIWGDYIKKLSIFENGDNIDLSMIELKDNIKHQGIGTAIMKYLTKYADENGKIIHLTPDPTMGTNINVLKSFYMKHGFHFNKGVHKDERFRSTMIRHPRKINNL